MFVVVIRQVEVAQPMEDDMVTSSYPIVIPTGSEEPLSCSPTGPSHLSNQLDSMNFERWGHTAELIKNEVESREPQKIILVKVA